MNILTDADIVAVDNCTPGGRTNFARAIESAVIKALAAGVGVEPAGDGYTLMIRVGSTPSTMEDKRITVLCGGVYTKEDFNTAIAAARVQALEEAAKVCEALADEYNRREGLKYPELKTDAETGAGQCEAAIRALIGAKT